MGAPPCLVAQFIDTYTTPPQKMLSRDLTARLNKQIDFLAECRPLAVAMGNAIKHLKMHVQHLDPSLPEAEAKSILLDTIDNFIMVGPCPRGTTWTRPEL